MILLVEEVWLLSSLFWQVLDSRELSAMLRDMQVIETFGCNCHVSQMQLLALSGGLSTLQ